MKEHQNHVKLEVTKSNLAEHSWDFCYRFPFYNISIVCTERIPSKRKLKETFHMKSSQPNLNLPEIWNSILVFIHKPPTPHNKDYLTSARLSDSLIRSGQKYSPLQARNKITPFHFLLPL